MQTSRIWKIQNRFILLDRWVNWYAKLGIQIHWLWLVKRTFKVYSLALNPNHILSQNKIDKYCILHFYEIDKILDLSNDCAVQINLDGILELNNHLSWLMGQLPMHNLSFLSIFTWDSCINDDSVESDTSCRTSCSIMQWWSFGHMSHGVHRDRRERRKERKERKLRNEI